MSKQDIKRFVTGSRVPLPSISDMQRMLRSNTIPNVNVRDADEFDMTALMNQSTSDGSKDAMEWLLSQCHPPADINLQSKIGYTALRYAVVADDPDKVRLLLEHGADRYITDKWGETPLQYARENSKAPQIIFDLESYNPENRSEIAAREKIAIEQAKRDRQQEEARIEDLMRQVREQAEREQMAKQVLVKRQEEEARKECIRRQEEAKEAARREEESRRESFRRQEEARQQAREQAERDKQARIHFEFEAKVNRIADMGFDRDACVRTLRQVNCDLATAVTLLAQARDQAEGGRRMAAEREKQTKIQFEMEFKAVRIAEMGFDKQDCLSALRRSNGNDVVAIDYLFQTREQAGRDKVARDRLVAERERNARDLAETERIAIDNAERERERLAREQKAENDRKATEAAAEAERDRLEREKTALFQLAGHVSDSLTSHGLPVEIPFSVLKSWTANFNDVNIVAKGGFGDVYKGVVDYPRSSALLPGRGLLVAIKKVKNIASLAAVDTKSVVKNELRALTVFRSCPNIIRLIGYSIPPIATSPDHVFEMSLAYELAPLGDLMNFLCSRPKELTWQYRLRIAIGIATGLNHLHTHATSPTFHRDIKSSNVVLMHDFTPKLINFGMSNYVQKRAVTVICREENLKEIQRNAATGVGVVGGEAKGPLKVSTHFASNFQDLRPGKNNMVMTRSSSSSSGGGGGSSSSTSSSGSSSSSRSCSRIRQYSSPGEILRRYGFANVTDASEVLQCLVEKISYDHTGGLRDVYCKDVIVIREYVRRNTPQIIQQTASVPIVQKAALFIAANAFAGAKAGYIFTTTTNQGTGYYLDVCQLQTVGPDCISYMPNFGGDGAGDSMFPNWEASYNAGVPFVASEYSCNEFLGDSTMLYDALCEVFSFGIVLLELLTGRKQGVDDNYDCLLQNDVENLSADCHLNDWPTQCMLEFKHVAKSCVKPRKERILTILPILHHLTEIKSTHDLPTAMEQVLAEKLKSVEAELLSHRGSKEIAIQQSLLTVTCCACSDNTILLSEAIPCSRPVGYPHMLCILCLNHVVSTQSKNMKIFTDNERQIVCPFCISDNPQVRAPYDSDEIVCLHCNKESRTAFFLARETASKLEVENMARVRESALEKKIEDAKLEVLTLKNNREADILNEHRRRIIDTILTPKCPHCNLVFMDWSSCFAVKCESEGSHGGKAAGCGKYFCGWCMAKYNRQNECHEHVRICAKSLNPGNYFSKDRLNGMRDFLRVQAPDRKLKIENYIASNNLTPQLRHAILTLMQQSDLTPLGIHML